MNLDYSSYVFDEELPRLRAAHEKGLLELKTFDVGGRQHHFVQTTDTSSEFIGVLPSLLNNILDARKRTKRLMADAQKALEEDFEESKDPSAIDNLKLRVATLNSRQLALKICANSVYGFTGAKNSVLPLQAIAETTTAYGRELISICATRVPEEFPSLSLIYGDTDSVLFKTQTTKLDEGWNIGTAVESWLNDHVLPPLGAYLSMECECVCRPYMLLKKKRYIGRMYTHAGDTHGHVEYKGIELKRKDSLQFTRRLYSGIIDTIFCEQASTGKSLTDEVIAYLMNEFNEIQKRSGRYTAEDFAQKKTLREISTYKSPLSLPHVALMLRTNAEIERGERQRCKFVGGDQILYTIAAGKGDITSRAVLLEDCTSLDDIDMMHFLTSAQRSLSNVLQFFMDERARDALFDTLGSTLYLRQNRMASLLTDEQRLRRLKRRFEKEYERDEPVKKVTRQLTLFGQKA